jgi:hypothetical protein
MLFVFVEDGTLEVVAGIGEARRRYESIDVESGVFRFYDADGRSLTPVFPQPTRVRRWLFFSTVTPGTFDLMADAGAESDPIERCLEETAALEPNPWFGSLEAVRAFLAHRTG